MRQQFQELSKKLYRVNVPIVATYSEEEIGIFGIGLDVRNGNLVKDSFEEMTGVMINIDKMINIYLQGYPISINNQQDSSEIYKELERYLSGVNTSQDFSPNQIKVEDQRVEEIDKFAAEIFGLNRNTVIKGSISSMGGYDLGAKLMNINHRSNSMNNAPAKKTGVLAAYENDEPEETPTIVNNEVYINNQLPNINVNEVKRRSMYRERASLNNL